jgi:hypothetical protein
MGFRVPLSSLEPTSVNTADLSEPGVRMFQGTDDDGNPVGLVEFRTGVPGDDPAYLRLTSVRELSDPFPGEIPPVELVVGSVFQMYGGAVQGVPGPVVRSAIEQDTLNGGFRSRMTLSADLVDLTGAQGSSPASVVRRDYADGRTPRIRSGSGTYTTNATGDFTIGHGLGVIPSAFFVQATFAGAVGTQLLPVRSVTASGAVVRAFYDRAVQASTSLTVYWAALS